ncbi:otoconin-90 isoform X4 [Paroedura picta]|uniref:otoconin-90 isoform X4 n=1 Tax=Paroedura picta TaxID=143630 RepID=UPI0040579F43
MLIILLVNMLMVSHSGGQGQLPEGLMDLPNAPEGNLHNMTFFNGAFANVEGVAFFFDCLGSHFTWLQSIFTNFPALLTFVSKLKCVTGLCPRDFEDYGCACRYEMEGLPVDEADSCCFQHRKCYEEATEEDCGWDPSKITVDFSCLTKNLTCESEDTCERILCSCDKAAIECFVHARINSSLHNFDVSFCHSLATEMATEKSRTTVFAAELQQQETENLLLTTVAMAEAIPLPTDGTILRTPRAAFVPDLLRDGGLDVFRGDGLPGSINLLLQNPEQGDVPSESGDPMLRIPEAGADVPSESGDPVLRTPEARADVPLEYGDPVLRTPEARGDVPSESGDPMLRNPEARDVPPESGDQLLKTPEAGAKDVSQTDPSVSSYLPPESMDMLLNTPAAGEVPGGVFAAYEESMPSGLAEKVFLPEGVTTTALPPNLNSIAPEVEPTPEFLGRTTGKATGNLFKIADAGEESMTYSTLAPAETLEPEDAFGKVCDRFSFLQVRDNGQVKREMAQLGEMLYCLTDRCPEDFELYGCYCGQEGKGQPMDDLDRCCFSHHCCVEQLKKLGCHPDRNSRAEVLCFDHSPKCIGWTMCEKLLCSCDKAAAECMATAPYNESLMFPNKQTCQEDSLLCRRGPSSSDAIGARTSSEEESSSEEEGEAESVLRRERRAAHRPGPSRRVVPLQGR